MHRGSLGNGDWIKLNGPFNLVNIDSLTFRTSGGSGAAGTGVVEVHLDAVDGPLLHQRDNPAHGKRRHLVKPDLPDR